MFLLERKLSAFLMLLFLSMAVVQCGHSDLETQLIEENSGERASLPPEVKDAIRLGKDEVEVPIHISDSNKEGLSKPSSFSRHYIIDYIEEEENSTLVLEKPKPPAPSLDAATCGSSTAFSVKNFKWQTVPILYSINTKNLTEGVDSVAAKAAIVNAFKSWDAEVSGLFVEAKEGETPQLTVRWAPIDGKNRVLALAENTFNNKTKVIISSRMTFDTGDIWKVFPSLDCKKQGSEFDIENVASHEVGHVLGILHPPNTNKNKSLTLYALTGAGETLKRTLDKGDKTGVAKLYPKKKK